jgi:hypothetical protein
VHHQERIIHHDCSGESAGLDHQEIDDDQEVFDEEGGHYRRHQEGVDDHQEGNDQEEERYRIAVSVSFGYAVRKIRRSDTLRTVIQQS